ncbi:MAG TPA: response regulator [Spirochaetota bacterium]|nr:response regulator [Spirochaetota bacterium]
MGLYIVKKIIDSLSGTIEIQSEPGKGTAFKIVLKKYDKKEEEYIKPVKASKPIRLLNQTESVEDSGYDETKDTVLIAEDNIDFLAFLKTELAESYNILVATNGSEALDKVRNIKKPDLIISDIMMGGMDGNLLLEEIKNDEDLNDIPFIFMTAKTALKEKIDGINRGAVAYITKPFDIKELKAQIHSILENRERQIEKMKSSVIEALSGKKSVEPNDHINSNIDLNCIDYAISDKEKDIVLLIIEGLQNKEIAKRLKLSENYVGKKISEIFAKTNSSNRVELANKIKKNPNSI